MMREIIFTIRWNCSFPVTLSSCAAGRSSSMP